jgi:hypothetical protein
MDLKRSGFPFTVMPTPTTVAPINTELQVSRADFGPFIRQEGRPPLSSVADAHRRPGKMGSKPRNSFRLLTNSPLYDSEEIFLTRLDVGHTVSTWISTLVERLASFG